MKQLLILAAMRMAGLLDWGLLMVSTPRVEMELRPGRKLMVAAQDYLESISLLELTERLDLLLDPDTVSTHPGYEACCPGCSVMYRRGNRTSALHYCEACGPVAGRLEFE